jgi:hypothetical protein
LLQDYLRNAVDMDLRVAKPGPCGCGVDDEKQRLSASPGHTARRYKKPSTLSRLGVPPFMRNTLFVLLETREEIALQNEKRA